MTGVGKAEAVLPPCFLAFAEQRPLALPACQYSRSFNELGGADYRTRTCDPLITNEVLYQLS